MDEGNRPGQLRLQDNVVRSRRKSSLPHVLFATFVGLVLVVLIRIKPPREIGVQVAVIAMAVLMAVVIRQCCYWLCELQRLPVMSAREVWKAAVECSQLPISTWLVFLICLLLSLLTVLEDADHIWETISRDGHMHFLVALVTVLCLWQASRMEQQYHHCHLGVSYTGENLAWSFTVNYLLMLVDPCGRLHDRSLCSLRERMAQYEQDNDVVLAVKKLIILMPTSCYIEPELGVGGDEDIEVANRMDNLVISRAGNKERIFTNTVYKIRNDDNSPYYCVAEGATPLLTLNDMRECGELTAQQQQEQMNNFCDKIRELVEANTACRSRFLLVQYNDVREDGTPVPVSSVLRNVIRKELGVA
ncbi:transmembrane protein sting isoform X1 [Amblyomma americanum]